MIARLHPVAPADFAASLSRFDALVVFAAAPLATSAVSLPLPPSLRTAIENALAVDVSLTKGVRTPMVIPCDAAPGKRLILAPAPALTDDTDDVRLVAEGIAAAVQRAVEAGATKPLVTVSVPDDARYVHAREVAALAALGTAWAPLEAREARKAPPAVSDVGMLGLDPPAAARVSAIEEGRWLARDITGTDPERMAPSRAAEFCVQAFEATGVKLSVERDVSGYPLIAAVSRASMQIERHRPCVVRLVYTPSGPVTRTVLIAAKGVTYDTGGADLKTEGAMAGMSRDKGGAGAAAGLVRAIEAMKLPGVRVVALLGMVRNSVGEDSYVSDEIIKARSGVRVRIGNTDAEGRLVLADLLAALREEAASATDPLFVSIATLTGHVYRAFGPYTGALENAAARARGTIAAMSAHGDAWGEPMEWTLPRREDYAFVAARSSAEDVVSSNRLASVNTPRGHQGPYAFLDVASGIKGTRLPYVHLDIGGAAVSPADWQFGRPTGAPLAMLAAFAGDETLRRT